MERKKWENWLENGYKNYSNVTTEVVTKVNVVRSDTGKTRFVYSVHLSGDLKPKEKQILLDNLKVVGSEELVSKNCFYLPRLNRHQFKNNNMANPLKNKKIGQIRSFRMFYCSLSRAAIISKVVMII